jgi:hypothetical protein
MVHSNGSEGGSASGIQREFIERAVILQPHRGLNCVDMRASYNIEWRLIQVH